MLEYAKLEENEVEEAGKTKKQNNWNRRIISLPKLSLEAQQAYLHEY
jgi:hypothetical protein